MTLNTSSIASPARDWAVPKNAVIKQITDDAQGVSTYELAFTEAIDRDTYSFLPGQFNMLYLPGIGEVAISISSDPGLPKTLHHTIRAAGSVTQALATRSPGDFLGLRGPFGSSWPVKFARGGDVLLVAGGIGLAPLRPAIYRLIANREKYGKITVLVGARAPEDLLFTDEYADWERAGIEVIRTVDKAGKNWSHRVGVVPMLFYQLRPDPRRTTVFTCGPEIMMRFVVYEALARRIPKDRIFVSLERNMKCAVGFCGHCQYGPHFLCKEGPVLSYKQIEPYFNVEEF